MILPEYEREIYEKNPIIEVVSQVDFPILLKLGSEPPALFQEKIRETFPFLDVGQVVADLTAGSPGFVDRGQAVDRGNLYIFTSSDRKSRLLLNSQFLAYSVNNYSRWESFKAVFEDVLKIFLEIYPCTHFVRRSLNYKDLFSREKLSVNLSWSSLLTETFFGPLGNPIFDEKSILDIRNLSVLELDRGKAAIKSNLLTNTATKEIAFLLDCDFFSEEVCDADIKSCTELFDQFNKYARSIFRYSVKDRLRESLGPTQPGSN